MVITFIEQNPQYWILILLLSNLLIIAIVKYSLNIGLSAFLDNFLQLKRKEQSQKVLHPITRILLLFNFVTLLALWLAILITIRNGLTEILFNKYMMILTLTIGFLLLKRYLNYFIASLLDFIQMMQLIELYRDNARILSGIPLLLISLIWIVLSGEYTLSWWIVLSSALLLLLVLIFRLILSFKEIIARNVFYFIVYLCALEIGPYLLLYKYFIA